MKVWDDSWILSNHDPCESQKALFSKYICDHTEESRGFDAFKHHLRSLGLTRYHKYTQEQDEWLISHYPTLGLIETANLFKKEFGIKPSVRSLTGRVAKLGLHISDSRRRQLIECNKARTWAASIPEGTVRKKTGMIKTKSGWMRLGRILGVPNGYYAVHLDRDVSNNNPKNIAIVDRVTSMKMTLYNLWSEDPEITKAGILCCELETIINKEA